MASSNGNVLIRPEQINTLPFLDENKKTQYRTGLARLWQQLDQNPQGSPQHQEIREKIRAASSKIMQEISSRNRPGSGAGAQQQAGGMAPQQQTQLQQQQAQQGGGGGGGGGLGAGGGSGGGPGQAGAPQNPPQITQAVQQLISAVTIHVPQNIPPQSHASYRQNWQRQAAAELTKKETAMQQGRAAQMRMQQLQRAGQEVPQHIQTQYNTAKTAVQDTDSKWVLMRNRNEQVRMMNAQILQQQQQHQQQQGQGQNLHQQVNGALNAQPDTKPEQRTSQSPPQQHGNFSAQSQHVQAQGQNMPSQPVPNAQQQPQSANPHQTPQSTTQTQATQNFPQHPSQQRPQVNPQFAQQQQQQQQHQGTPISANPNSVGQQPSRPQVLSQQAAMAQAAAQYATSQQQHPPGSNQAQTSAQPQVPNGLPFNNHPSSATQGNTPTSAYPHSNMPPAQQAPTNKFPIAKTMHLDPRLQQPVAGPPSRPTLANQGMNSQPGLTRPQPFTLEGEGDHVLSKRKLDELVRQVTGLTDVSPEAGGLTPEVEEAVLTLADNFVDNVITSACRLAKLRPANTLDVKDVQMALERNYGIRIPGYSLDEVRTVRKFQPAPGWQSKMQAVQTAKTLGGVGKPDP